MSRRVSQWRIHSKDTSVLKKWNEFLISVASIIISKVSISLTGVQTFLPGKCLLLISVTVVNLLVSPLTALLNVLLILAVKTTPQLRDKYNALLACLEKLTLWLVRRDNHSSFLTNYRLTESTSPHQIFCPFPYAARHFISVHSPYEGASVFGADKHREAHIDKIPF